MAKKTQAAEEAEKAAAEEAEKAAAEEAEKAAAEEAEKAAAEEAAAEEAEKAAQPAKRKVYQVGEKIHGFIVTTAGLPNTCSITGKEITEGYWFAANTDEARSGLGLSQAAFENPLAGETAV